MSLKGLSPSSGTWTPLVALLGERQCWRIFKSSIEMVLGEMDRKQRLESHLFPSQLELQSGSERNFIESVKPSPSCSLFRMYIGGERRWSFCCCC